MAREKECVKNSFARLIGFIDEKLLEFQGVNHISK